MSADAVAQLEKRMEAMMTEIHSLRSETAQLRSQVVTSSNLRKTRADKAMQQLDAAGVESLASWTGRARVKTEDTSREFDKKEALCLVHLLSHYHQIVYLVYSLWRKGLTWGALSYGTSTKDSDPARCHEWLPKVFLERAIPVTHANLKYWGCTDGALSKFIGSCLSSGSIDLVATVIDTLQLDITDCHTREYVYYNRGKRALLHEIVQKSGSVPLVNHLLNQVSPDQLKKILHENDDHSGSSIIHVASKALHVRLVAMLLAMGAVSDLGDSEAKTPLNVVLEPLVGKESSGYSSYYNTAPVDAEKSITVVQLLLRGENNTTGATKEKQINRPVGDKALTALHVACDANLPKLVKVLLDHGGNPTLLDSEGKSALWRTVYAAKDQQSDTAKQAVSLNIAKELLRVTPKPEDHGQVLHVAAKNLLGSFVGMLLQHGAKADLKDGDGRTPLNAMLLGKETFSPGLESTMKTLLDNIPLSGTSCAEVVNMPDNQGNTSLHSAVRIPSLALVERLLEAGGDRDAQNSEGKTPLCIFLGETVRGVMANVHQLHEPEKSESLWEFLVDMARLLIPAQPSGIAAQMQWRDAEGRTVLHMAAMRLHLGLIQLFLENGASVDAKDKQGYTPLLAMIGHSDKGSSEPEDIAKIGRALVAAGADLHAVGEDGSVSALHLAITGAHPQIVKWLIEEGADLCAVNAAGQTPLVCAQRTLAICKAGRSQDGKDKKKALYEIVQMLVQLHLREKEKERKDKSQSSCKEGDDGDATTQKQARTSVEESDRSSSPPSTHSAKLDSSSCICEVCNITVTSEQVMLTHLAGDKHRRALKRLQAGERGH